MLSFAHKFCRRTVYYVLPTSPNDEQKDGTFVDPNSLTLNSCKIDMGIWPWICRTKPGILRPLHVLLISCMKSGEAADYPPEPAGFYILNVLDVRGNGLQVWGGWIKSSTWSPDFCEDDRLGATFVSMAKIVVFSCIVTFSWVVRPLSSLGCILYVTLSLPLSRTGGRYHHGRAVPSLGQDSALQCHQGVVFFFQGFSQGFNSVSKLHSIFPVPKRVLEAETPRNNHQTQFSWVLRLITVDMYRLCFMSYGPIDY